MPQEQFEEFKKITQEMYDLHVRKNHDYSAEGIDNIGSLGERGVFVRLWDKMCRMRALLWDAKDQKVKDESLSDTIMDLATYAVILLILRRGKWGS